jgi:hypothetical protein
VLLCSLRLHRFSTDCIRPSIIMNFTFVFERVATYPISSKAILPLFTCVGVTSRTIGNSLSLGAHRKMHFVTEPSQLIAKRTKLGSPVHVTRMLATRFRLFLLIGINGGTVNRLMATVDKKKMGNPSFDFNFCSSSKENI